MVTNTEKRSEINEKVNPDDLPEILDVDQACQLLGIGKNSLYYLTQHKKIPGRKCGKSFRFLKSRLMEWLRGDEK